MNRRYVPNIGGKKNDIQFLLMIAAASALSLGLLFYTYRLTQGTLFASRDKKDDDDEELEEYDSSKGSIVSADRPRRRESGMGQLPQLVEAEQSRPETPVMSNVKQSVANIEEAEIEEENEMNGSNPALSFVDLEELDKQGKIFFKAQKYMEAADCFTKALEVGEALRKGKPNANVVTKQEKTLLNNRSAMYEKQAIAVGEGPDANMWVDLALADVDMLLSHEVSHAKARQRKLRLLEMSQPPRYFDAMIEICAMQLLFMQENRDRLRMGLPLPAGVKPPVEQDKIEKVMHELLPLELDKIMASKEKEKPNGSASKLPASHTIMQLLKSFRGYNAWMAVAARDESVESLTTQLNDEVQSLEKIKLLLRRGRRHAFDKAFSNAVDDFDAAMDIVNEVTAAAASDESQKSVLLALEIDEDYPRLLEWAGLCRHLRYDLDGALDCYDKCSDLEPTNTEILVKRAGVKMDAGKVDAAVELFQTALALEPDATDALLHRSNLHMMQGKTEESKSDLERCVALKPDFTLAYLRLATVHMATNDIDNAMNALESAGKLDPNSSDVHSYRGELYFAKGQLEDAKEEFEKAMENDPNNPNAFVNAALVVLNTPSSSGMPDVQEGIRLLNQAIKIDPQFHAAYVHLGQLKLSMATNLSDARDVVALYDKGIKECRTKEEAKDICSMRILAVAQVEAASALNMETLNMQAQ
mmetsp:Transcript_9363/g.13874  ORF Transcript_9363/g.13874 Transcript_9363/m.13874 type:complete len:700 (-) Transcript_9363:23-2122(-)